MLFGLPVQVRKNKDLKELISITIRVDGDTIGEVDDKLQTIARETLKYITVKPKMCMWDKLTPDKIDVVTIYRLPNTNHRVVLHLK